MSRRIQELLETTQILMKQNIKPVMQSNSSIMQLVSPMILMHSGLHELVCRQKMLDMQVTVSLDIFHINYMALLIDQKPMFC